VDVATKIETDDELLPRFRSLMELNWETVAVFVIVCPPSFKPTTAAMARVAVAFGASVPIVHLPEPKLYAVPDDEVAETNVNPEGRTSCAVSISDAEGPAVRDGQRVVDGSARIRVGIVDRFHDRNVCGRAASTSCDNGRNC